MLRDLVIPAIDGFFLGILKDSFFSFFTSITFFSLIFDFSVFFGFLIGARILLDNFFFISSAVNKGFFNGIRVDFSAKRLSKLINATWLNADQVRKDANDWDFSPEGRLRQSNRMRKLAEKAISEGKHALADFVC